MSEYLKIYRPLITNRVTQHFGENKACTYPNGAIVGKRGGQCPAGSEEYYPTVGMKGHNGTDFAAWMTEPIFHAATFDGWMRVESDMAGGIGVDVISDKPVKFKEPNGNIYEGYVKCRYWHLTAPVGHNGKKVKLGQQIGLAGNTGASSGVHLHFGVKKCTKDGNATEPGNGYFGAFNHEPFMDLATDAKTAANYLLTPPPMLTEQEKKDIQTRLNFAQKALALLLEIKRLST